MKTEKSYFNQNKCNLSLNYQKYYKYINIIFNLIVFYLKQIILLFFFFALFLKTHTDSFMSLLS